MRFFSLYEGTSRPKAELLMTDTLTRVTARKRERNISRRTQRDIKRWVEPAAPGADVYDKGKGGGPWTNYDKH